MAAGPEAPLGPPPPEYRPRGYESGDHSMRYIALAAVVIAGVVMAGVYTLSGRHHAGVPVIEAEATPLRVKPANPGGMQVAGADDAVLTSRNGAETDQLAPPPEAPAPQSLQAATRAAEQAPHGPPSWPAPHAPPVVSAPTPLAPVAAPPPISAPPPNSARVQPDAGAQQAAGTEVQLAALQSQAAADAAWTRLVHQSPALFAGHHPRVVRADRDGKIFWRLRTGAFKDIAAATAFCAQLRASGAACTIASF